MDILLDDDDKLHSAAGARIIHTPAHTPRSISLYLEDKKLVVVGDLLSNKKGLSLPSRAFTTDLKQVIAPLRKLVSLDFETICFGHGLPIRRQARKKVLDFVTKIERRFLTSSMPDKNEAGDRSDARPD